MTAHPDVGGEPPQHAEAALAHRVLPDREICVASLTEIAVKQTRGKLTFAKPDVMAGVADLQLRVLPYTAEHAFRLYDLPTHHADPFDRQIIAQALVENVPVVTPHEVFSLYEGLKVVW
jgi:PIN domain nuclease of toxin-antitoxin system